MRGRRLVRDLMFEELEYLVLDDVAEAVRWMAARPAHVNANYSEIMPNCQAPGPLVFRRRSRAPCEKGG